MFVAADPALDLADSRKCITRENLCAQEYQSHERNDSDCREPKLWVRRSVPLGGDCRLRTGNR
jgi:hypothetical protein